MKAPLPFLCLLALARLCAGEAAPAASEPPELTQLRQQSALRALTSAKTLAEQFANALTTIAKEAGAAGDYDQALAAQRRRDELVQLYGKASGETASSSAIVLKPADARVNGAVSYDRQLNALIGWKTVGSIASWDVSRITPGAYEITLTYGVADTGEAGRVNPFAPAPDLSTGGEFEFYEDSSLSGAGQNRRTGQVTSTGGWTNLATLTLAPVQLTRTSARMALRITRVRGTGGVMHLKEIRLAPPSPAPAESAPPPVDELAALRQAHNERMRAAITAVVGPYTGTVNALAEKAAATGDTDLAGDLQAEAKRATELVEDPVKIISGGPRAGVPKSLLAEDFKELSGATFAADKRNTGDRFMVNQGGSQFPVRLLWVRCPPTETDAADALKSQAAYFGITPEDARTIGTRARKFTAAFLQDKDLTLFTRGARDPDGALLVAVHPEGIGDFAGVLVDNGLASIESTPARSGSGRRRDEAALQALQEREAAAKARPIPPGAWAMKGDE